MARPMHQDKQQHLSCSRQRGDGHGGVGGRGAGLVSAPAITIINMVKVAGVADVALEADDLGAPGARGVRAAASALVRYGLGGLAGPCAAATMVLPCAALHVRELLPRAAGHSHGRACRPLWRASMEELGRCHRPPLPRRSGANPAPTARLTPAARMPTSPPESSRAFAPLRQEGSRTPDCGFGRGSQS
jgi:hypothetical protein